MEEITESNDSVDFISKLPEEILHQILSSLPIKEIVRTIDLSKYWYTIWSSYDCVFKFIFSTYKKASLEKDESMYVWIYSFVDRILSSRRRKMMSFRKFSLVTPCVNKTPQVVPFMNRRIDYAVESGVRDLNVGGVLFPSTEESIYKLPPSALSANSIHKLFLAGCKLECRNFVKLCSLTNLNLRFVCADNEVIQQLIVGCPLLENLAFVNCYGLHVVHLLKLVSFQVVAHDSLESQNKHPKS